MIRPTISCVIINYNNSECLEESVLSVLNQTVPVDEIIVSDDASSDSSAEIIRSLAMKYEAIKPILRKKNLGVSQNRHEAILSSSSQLVTTLDSDDFFYPTKIESELHALIETISDIAFSDVVLIDAQGHEYATLDLDYFDKLTTTERIEALIKRNRPIPRDMLFKREIYDKIGGFSDKLKVYEDFDLKMRILLGTEARWAYSHTRGTAYRSLWRPFKKQADREYDKALLDSDQSLFGHYK